MLSLKDSIHWIQRGTNKIHRTAVIYWDHVKIGENNVIGEYSVIGSPGEISGKDLSEFRGIISIGNNNIINSHVTIDKPYEEGNTQIGNNSFIMRKCYIGHDVVIGDNCILRPGTMIGGGVVLENYSNTGLGSLIRDHRRMGESSYLGMGAALVSDLEPFQIAIGNPAQPYKINEVQMKERNINIKMVEQIRKRWRSQ